VSVPTDDTRVHHEDAGSAPVRRTLRTILGVEAVDYAGHVNAAEEVTVAALGRYRAVIDALVVARGGRIFTTAPQSVLAEFESPVEAVRCALDIQEGIAGLHRQGQDPRPLQFRVGVHTGDVLRTGDNLLGDAVNVAARLEGIADPGSIYISQEVKNLVEAKLTVQFRFQGNKLLKNIPRPVATYEISATPIAAWRLAWKRSRRVRRTLILGLSLAALACGLAYLAYDSAQRLRTGVALQNTAAATILDKDPAPGTLAYGKTVLVDDGSCSGGQIKEVTGGNNNRNIPRSSHCVDRP
jgi:class 3 adenylate cyclase